MMIKLTLVPVLCNLGTHPGHRKQGAGSLLAAWAFEEADRTEMPIILHAEVAGPGMPLYKKLGYEERARFDLDVRQLGGREDVQFAVLIREPKSRTSSASK